MSLHCQHRSYEFFDLRLYGGFELKLDVSDVVVQILDVCAGPWGSAMQHLIKNYAHAPDVAAIAELLPWEDLRGCVERSPQTREFLSLGWLFNNSAEPEVTELCDTLFEQNVCGLDIAMDDFLLKKFFVAADQVSHKGDGFCLADASVLAILIEVAFEVAIFAELKDDVEVFSASEAIVHFNDEWRG